MTSADDLSRGTGCLGWDKPLPLSPVTVGSPCCFPFSVVLSLLGAEHAGGLQQRIYSLVAHAGAMGYFDGMVLDVAGTLLYAMTYGSRCFPTGLAAVVCDVNGPFLGSSRAAEPVARRRRMLYCSERRRTIRGSSS